jgi:membrane protease YdiL (CAAX protease family)
VTQQPPSPPPSGPPPPSAASDGGSQRAPVTVADGLVLVAWLVIGQVMLYGIALGLGVVGDGNGTGDRLAQVGILSAVLATSLAWLGLRGRLGAAWAPGRGARGIDVLLGVGSGVAGFVILLVGIGLLFQVVGFDSPEQQALQDVVGGGADALLAVVLAVVLAPVVEELVFRGALHQGLRRRAGFWPAALLSSGIFAVVHVEVVASSPVFLVQLFLLGVLFAWLLERTGNLLAPVIAHLVFNGISMSLAVLAARFEELDELAVGLVLLGAG